MESIGPGILVTSQTNLGIFAGTNWVKFSTEFYAKALAQLSRRCLVSATLTRALAVSYITPLLTEGNWRNESTGGETEKKPPTQTKQCLLFCVSKGGLYFLSHSLTYSVAMKRDKPHSCQCKALNIGFLS